MAGSESGAAGSELVTFSILTEALQAPHAQESFLAPFSPGVSDEAGHNNLGGVVVAGGTCNCHCHWLMVVFVCTGAGGGLWPVPGAQ